jgi:hypothetical protein
MPQYVPLIMRGCIVCFGLPCLRADLPNSSGSKFISATAYADVYSDSYSLLGGNVSGSFDLLALGFAPQIYGGDGLLLSGRIGGRVGYRTTWLAYNSYSSAQLSVEIDGIHPPRWTSNTRRPEDTTTFLSREVGCCRKRFFWGKEAA